ncbi:hypothetical protein FOB63_001258 [Clavispora lusitaniae]|uniref:uncharacterized protein n=1 Tax=Clavispora lusitaniae TaxID=36911 RepID=UPI00202C1BD3|nr:hypothetical protein FOB63_001258 [Clavispora lusitaniae]
MLSTNKDKVEANQDKNRFPTKSTRPGKDHIQASLASPHKSPFQPNQVNRRLVRATTPTNSNPSSFRSYDGNPYQYQVQSTYTSPAPGPAMHKGPGDARGQNPNAKSDSRQGGYRQY